MKDTQIAVIKKVIELMSQQNFEVIVGNTDHIIETSGIDEGVNVALAFDEAHLIFNEIGNCENELYLSITPNMPIENLLVTYSDDSEYQPLNYAVDQANNLIKA